MGLRCIIGHDYGEPETTTEREDRGEERVVTVREYRECRRCGHQKVLSENTEIRSNAVEGAGESGDGRAHPDPADVTDRGEEAQAAGRADAASTDASDLQATGDSAQEPPTTDDGVILEDDDEDGGREPGQWPDSEEATDDDAPGTDDEQTDLQSEWPEGAASEDADGSDEEYEAWPSAESEDEGFDAEPSSGGPADDVEFGGGLTPERSGGDPQNDDEETIEAGAAPRERTDEARADAPETDAGTDQSPADSGGEGDGRSTEASAGPGGEEQHSEGSAARTRDEGAETTRETPGTGIRRAEPGPTPTAQQRSADPEASFICPQCGYTADAHGSSLRTGDICPDCRNGYLTERGT